MKYIIFIILPFPSHYTASFSFANEYKKKGYNVIFTGTISQKELIEKEGFTFQEFQYSTEYNIKTLKSFFGLLIKTLVDKNFTKARFRDFTTSQLSSKYLYEIFTPEHIFIDEQLADYYFFFKQYNINITILNTKLSTKKVRSIPPLNSDFIPKNTFQSAFWSELLWQLVFTKHNIQNLLQKIAFGNKDEVYFWERLCKKKGWNWQKEIATNHVLNRSISNIPTIILAPEKLEFHQRIKPNNESYFHLTVERNESKYTTQVYIDLVDNIRIRQLTSKVIYCSFGTLAGVRAKKVLDFFSLLTTIAKKKSDWIFVISSSGLNTEYFEKMSNVHFFDYIPQIDLLKSTDLMITHGGLGSVKECLDANVAMYVLPLNELVDQKGNAARVEANGFGLKGILGKDDENTVTQKIENLLNFRKQV